MRHIIPNILLRLLLVRHGQTEWNTGRRFMGQMDIPLDETGLQQVRAVAHRLRDEKLDAIFSSDLKRAWQTALVIQAAIGEKSDAPPLLVSERRLREMCFGQWEGLTYAEIEASQPEELRLWEADLLNYAPPGGENMKEMGMRVSALLDEILQVYTGGNVLLVAHGGTFEALAMVHLGLAAGRLWQLHMGNTGISEFRFYPAGAILSRWNDTSHLEQPG